jgi:Rha family phage regulatory protein|nr:MAG TPA: regulatory protein [Bacteriophage sp.]
MNELVHLEHDEAVCSSLEVAEKFGKRHDKLISEIERMYSDLIGKGCAQNGGDPLFVKSSYIHPQNKQEYPMYLMNRDGFSLLVMGFTGKKALDWKLKYINAFNQMENYIREKQSQSWIETRTVGKLSRKAETDVLKQLVEYAKQQGSEHADMLYMTYSKLANKTVGVADRDTATAKQLMNLSVTENIILKVVEEGISQQLHYKEIYKNCKDRLAIVNRLAYLTV